MNRPIIEELRREARINEVCGSPEWTMLLDRAAAQMEHMDKMLRAAHAATDLATARRRAMKGLYAKPHRH